MDDFKRYKLNVHHDGAFLFLPLRYVDGQMVEMEVPAMSVRDLVMHLEAETGNPSTGLFYLPTPGDFKTIRKLGSKREGIRFFDVADSYGTMEVYMEHLSVSLDDYVCNRNSEDDEDKESIDMHMNEDGEPVESDNNVGMNEDGEPVESDNNVGMNEDGEDGEPGENEGDSIGKTEVGESSKRPEDSDSEDSSYEPSDDSDVESLASLDHLSEGEEDLREVRMGNPIAKIPTSKQLPKVGCNQNNEADERTVIQEEHDQFMQDLIEALQSKDGDEPEDPLQPPPEEVPVFPVHDKQTHWRMKRPKLGEKYEGPEQLKECISYYALANGYSLWYERVCKDTIIARSYCWYFKRCEQIACQKMWNNTW